jgi:4'-phosphopantetheinyl transferase
MSTLTSTLVSEAPPLSAPLREGVVELWTVAPERLRDPEQLHTFSQWLDGDEEARRERFVFERDAHAYLVGHAMLRAVLARHTGVSPSRLRFQRNDEGRPELGPPERDLGLRFNLSRTAGLTVMAVAHRRALGVDVEFTGARHQIEEVAEAAFTAPELQALRRLPAEERPDAAYRLWTLKEAYLKARGLGLSRGLEAVAFELDDDGEATARFAASL